MLQLLFFITMIHFAKSGFINSHREVEDNCDCEELLIENRLLRELLLGGKKIVPKPLSESVPELESSIQQDGRNIDTGPIVEQIISTPSSSWSETKFYSTYKTQEIAPVTSEIPVLFRNRLIVTTITELETVEKILTSTLTSSVLVEVEPTSSLTISPTPSLSPTSSISPSSSLTPSQSISLSHASEGGKTPSPSITPSDSFSPAEETTQIQLIEPLLNPLSSLSPLNKDNSDPSIELSSAVNEDDNEKKQDKNIDRDKLQDNDLQISNAEETKNEKLTIKKRPLINKFRFGVSEFGFKPFKIWRF